MEASPLLDAELQAVEAAGLAADLLLEGGAVGDQLDDQASPWLLLGPRTSSPILPDPSASSELSGADEDRDAEERRWYNQAEADSSAQSITVPKASRITVESH